MPRLCQLRPLLYIALLTCCKSTTTAYTGPSLFGGHQFQSGGAQGAATAIAGAVAAGVFTRAGVALAAVILPLAPPPVLPVPPVVLGREVVLVLLVWLLLLLLVVLLWSWLRTASGRDS